MQTSTWYCTTCGAANDGPNTHCFACAQPYIEDVTDTPGADRLLDRYRLLTQVGVGGFGVVYRAIDTQSDDSIVAIKQINLRGLSPQKMIEATDAFNREVQHLTPLQHPNLPRIYDQFTDPDHWYLVMEYIEGETLEHYLETRSLQRAYNGNQTFLPLEEIFPLAFQLCDVLTYLHTRHPPIIFRDLKPANIMRTAKGHLYLIDFGIARYFKPGQARDTTPLGSPGYAAPEQYGKAQTTPRADLYSLGALLHHLLTGEDPAEALFQFAPLPQIAGAELQMQKLDTLIRRMVHADSEQRPVSASEVKEEMQNIAHLVADPTSRIWYPPQGQTPPPSTAQDTFTLVSTRQQQMQAQQQKPKGTSRRKFIIRSAVGGAVVIIGTGIAGSVLVNLAGSFSWHRELPTTSGVHLIIHPSTRTTIALSPDAEHVAFTSPDGSFVEVYSIASDGMLVYLMQLHDRYFTTPISTLAWSPDSSHIATATIDGGIDIWSIKTSSGEVDYFPLYYPTYNAPIDMLAWSPDSKLLAIGGTQQALHIIDARTGKIIFQLQDTGAIHSRTFAWSPDSNLFVIANPASDQSSPQPALQVRNLKTGKQLFTFVPPDDVYMLQTAWSPDRNTIATLGNDGNVYLWNAANGSPITTLHSTDGEIVDLLWSNDSQSMALETEYGNLQVWSKQNNFLQFYPVHAGPTKSWLWLRDGRLAFIDGTKTMRYIGHIRSY